MSPMLIIFFVVINIPIIVIIYKLVVYTQTAKQTNERLVRELSDLLTTDNVHESENDTHQSESFNFTYRECYQVRPWVRYFARLLDILIFSAIVVFPVLYFLIKSENLIIAQDFITEVIINVIAMFIFCFYQAGVTRIFGSTPGKALMKINLLNAHGGPLTYKELLKREFGIYTSAMALGIPLLSLFSLLWAMKKLATTGKTFWDEEGGFIVRHQVIGTVRIIAYIVILLTIIVGMASLPVLVSRGY